jgi:hypothetical protein
MPPHRRAVPHDSYADEEATCAFGTQPALLAGPPSESRESPNAPKGQRQNSPGQSDQRERRPGLRKFQYALSPERAKQRVHAPVPPLQGLVSLSSSNPGRRYAALAATLCPGLICGCPFGAKRKRPSRREWPERLVGWVEQRPHTHKEASCVFGTRPYWTGHPSLTAAAVHEIPIREWHRLSSSIESLVPVHASLRKDSCY